MKAVTFMALMEAKRKRGRGVALTPEEEELLKQHPDPEPIPCGCGRNCGRNLRGSGDPQYMIGNKYVTPDCYYDSFGDEIEEHPIISPVLALRLRSRQNSAAV
jgi:hypothetical protein